MIKKIRTILVFLIILYFAQKVGIVKSFSYFDFDEVQYFNQDIKKDDLGLLLDNQNSNITDSIRVNLIVSSFPKHSNDLVHLEEIEKFGYKKVHINFIQKKLIGLIFSQGLIPQFEKEGSGCLPVYRDIFIFKKNNNIIGIAKVCIECEDTYFFGEKVNTFWFGNNLEYFWLKELVCNKHSS